MRDAFEKATTQARELKEQAIKEGTEKGFKEGFEKGREEAKTEFSPVLETLQKSIEELSSFRKMMYTKMEREMMEMTLALVKKIIHFELSTRPDRVQEMIRLAVSNVLDKESMIIKINPEDKTHAESFRPELQQIYGEIKNITFEVHPGIQRGGCVIESNFGTVDARIDKLDEQIDRILHLAPPDNEPQETSK
jgi:flagellar assembly protein FliH